MATKYSTFTKNGNLYFKITEGQFKDVSYRYKTLNSNGGLIYDLYENKKCINKNNKLLFESAIREILNDKLGVKNV